MELFIDGKPNKKIAYIKFIEQKLKFVRTQQNNTKRDNRSLVTYERF